MIFLKHDTMKSKRKNAALLILFFSFSLLNAQYEIKEYASKIQDIIEPLCPITMKAFNNHKTITLSKQQIKALEIFEFQLNKLTEREKIELEDLLKDNV